RPYGDSGPLVCSFDFLENYFVAQGRTWERYAWLKARALTGDLSGSQHRALDAIVRPFVFRKYLDYASLSAMRELHAEVRRDVERRELAEHVKLGPGGIRRSPCARPCPRSPPWPKGTCCPRRWPRSSRARTFSCAGSSTASNTWT